jgi:LmbE family N-acetylglucosaminyl deacetylase
VSRIFALVSPHLDDAALSCSRLLAANPGSQVFTVFTGGPSSVDPLPEWDLLSPELRAGDDVTAIRRVEDEESCALLQAAPHHLGFWDEQYRASLYGYAGPATDEELLDAVAGSLSRALSTVEADAWVMPLGLVHPDHQLTAVACLRAFTTEPAPERYLYWDLPYRLWSPDQIGEAEDVVKAAGFALEETELPSSDDVSLKRKAVGCHRSQIAPLDELVEAAVVGPETFFRLTRTSAGS